MTILPNNAGGTAAPLPGGDFTMLIAQEQLEAGQLDESLATVKEAVRKQPQEVEPRWLLSQLYLVAGEWDRAAQHLEILTRLSPEIGALRPLLEGLIRCELKRAEVFSGRSRPTVLGEPDEWTGLLIHACELLGRGGAAAARELRERALRQAQQTAGVIDDVPFNWLADADPRLGPVLEVMMNGAYYWMPFFRIKRIAFSPPESVRDLVWTPADFIWSEGGEGRGHVPVRYPGTESTGDPELRLARKTDWCADNSELNVGFGQRVFYTDGADREYPLLEVRTVEFTGG